MFLRDEKQCLADLNEVLEKLDPKNEQALRERAHCYMSQQRWTEACIDLNEVPMTEEVIQELKLCVAQKIQQQM